MKTCIFVFSDAGSKLALKLKESLGADLCSIHSTEKFAAKYGFTSHKSLRADMKSLFNENDALIFISAAGIAVRYIAPFVKDKTKDPAVLVMDDQGRFCISLLSGHIGGANEFAQKIAEFSGAVPVVTTATDGAGKFSCDAWASKHGCAISSMKIAKDISAAILTGDVPVSSEFELPGELPSGLAECSEGKLGIYIGIRKKEPYKKTLRLIPEIVTLGIGCRKDTPFEAIQNAVSKVLEENGIDFKAVSRVTSIDVKKDEAGLLEFAKKHRLETLFYSAVDLEKVPGEFEESAFVKKTVGIGNVCERAACAGNNKLIIPKTACSGVTVAAAISDWRIEF